MNLAALELLLHDRIGLDLASIGASTLPRVVAARMAAHGVSSAEHYTTVVAGNPSEWAALVGELVVPESWFFRGGLHFFEYLARGIRTRLAESVNSRTMRVLCVPCSTGEEPYSLAIALEREGVPAARCTIDGVDISRDHLLRAVAGRYPSFSFREATADPRRECFDETEPGKWDLHSAIRDRVVFRPDNLVDPAFLAGEPPFDLILCRNLFIYLTPDGASRAMANLERLLTADGRLCLTAAEADRIPVTRFIADGPASLAIFKKHTGDPPAPPRSAVIRLPSHQPASGGVRKPPDSPAVVSTTTLVAAPCPPSTVDPLKEGRRLADAGELAAARAACELAPSSAARFSLLGVIHLAAGRHDDATEAFRKALYLDPDDTESLLHMIALCEQRGDPGQVAGLRRRLNRLAKGAAP